MADTPNPFPAFIENAFAPEFFASAFAGSARDGPNMRLTFVSHRVNHDPAIPLGTVQGLAVTVRLVMSRDAVASMVANLTASLEAAEPQVQPSPPPSPSP